MSVRATVVEEGSVSAPLAVALAAGLAFSKVAKDASTDALAARDAATTSAGLATQAATSAAGAAQAAEGSIAEVVASASQAATSAGAAQDSATASAGSATAAAGSATASAGSATVAAGSATAAAGSATASAGSATAAAGSASASADSATASAGSATASAGSLTASQAIAAALQGTLTGNTRIAASAAAYLTATDLVDGFVYDTRLDSDGGAWTRKCEGASWYQEALNTATRGARREFPKVAGIVLRQTDGVALSIYDLTDLDTNGLPRLWLASIRRTSAGSSGPALGLTSTVLRGVYASNGHIWIASNGGLIDFDFANDGISLRNVTGLSRRLGGIAGRNAFGNGDMGYTSVTGTTGIVSSDVNAVHARVLPGAPLDAAGLPIPHVAVATAAGASVIHPNGFVANLTDAGGISSVRFVSDARLWITRGNAAAVAVGPIPYAASVAQTTWRDRYYDQLSSNSFPALLGVGTGARIQPGAVGNTNGLTFLAEDTANPANGMVSYAALAYATGWMVGDIRGAWCCDGATGTVTGGELVTNGGFDADLTGWTVTAGGTAAVTWSGGAASLIGDGVNAGRLDQQLTTAANQTYQITFAIGNAAIGLNIGTAQGSSNIAAITTAIGSNTFTFTAVGPTTWIRFTKGGSPAGTLDNVSVQPVAPDRSYKAKGLNVVGTLTRSAVATGADLAGWGGFGLANYLQQPANPDLDVGTGDFVIPVVIDTNGAAANGFIFDRADADVSGPTTARLALYLDSSGGLAALVQQTNASRVFLAPGIDIRNTGKRHVVFARRNGVAELWLDRVRIASAASTHNVTNTNAVLRVGQSAAALANAAWGGSIAMLRFSATAPTPAQIERMFNDELPLFRAGAKCFLGGTSAAVVGIGFDESRGVMPVATGDGVSEFTGLLRAAYLDSVAVPALANDTMRAVSSQGGFRLLASAGQAVAQRDATTLLDDVFRYGPKVPPRYAARGVTTDATPLVLAPRLTVGEGELVLAQYRVTARLYGPAGTTVGVYLVEARAQRDAGGNVAVVASTTTVFETAAAMDATVVADTASQTIAPQATGLGSTRLEWAAELVSLTRPYGATRYAAA